MRIDRSFEAGETLCVYLDYNIVRDLQDEKIRIQEIDALFQTNKKIIYPYTLSHVYEIANIPDSNSKREEIIDKAISNLNNFSGNRHLFEDEHELNKMSILNIDARDVFNHIQSQSLKLLIGDSVNWLDEQKKNLIREQIGATSHELNNYSPSRFLVYIEDLVNKHKSILPKYLQQFTTISTFDPQLEPLNLRIVKLFELLDLIGYQKDRYTQNSNVARWWDSLHCAFGGWCDYFLTNDKKTSKKAEFIYFALNLPTKVMHT